MKMANYFQPLEIGKKVIQVSAWFPVNLLKIPTTKNATKSSILFAFLIKQYLKYLSAS